MAQIAKIVPHLWYVDNAEEAARFYAGIFPDSRVDAVTAIPTETPSGPAESVKVVEFTLAGQSFMAIGAGPLDPFNHAISFMVMCDDQTEIDRTWDALVTGGQAEQCGWLKDRYGVCWQIVTPKIGDMMRDPNRKKAAAAMTALMGMVKIDIAALEKAYNAA